MNTEFIYKSFCRSISTYNDNAIVQKIIVEVLRILIAKYSISAQRVMELGCGTGMLTEALLKDLNMSDLFVNDLILEVKPVIDAKCSTKSDLKYEFFSGDITKVEFPKNLDLIVSGSTIQWVEDLDSFLNKLKESLTPGARFIFNTFGKSNLFELREVTDSGLVYRNMDEVLETASRWFTIEESFEEKHSLFFDEPIDVLKHLRNTGVNGIQSRTWTKSQLTKFQADYSERFTTDKGVCLTYHPMYLVLKR